MLVDMCATVGIDAKGLGQRAARCWRAHLSHPTAVANPNVHSPVPAVHIGYPSCLSEHYGCTDSVYVGHRSTTCSSSMSTHVRHPTPTPESSTGHREWIEHEISAWTHPSGLRSFLGHLQRRQHESGVSTRLRKSNKSEKRARNASRRVRHASVTGRVSALPVAGRCAGHIELDDDDGGAPPESEANDVYAP